MVNSSFIQESRIPIDIDPQSPNALKQVIELSRQTLQKLNELEERLEELESP